MTEKKERDGQMDQKGMREEALSSTGSSLKINRDAIRRLLKGRDDFKRRTNFANFEFLFKLKVCLRTMIGKFGYRECSTLGAWKLKA